MNKLKEQGRKALYVAPTIEFIELNLEKSFLQSGGDVQDLIDDEEYLRFMYEESLK